MQFSYPQQKLVYKCVHVHARTHTHTQNLLLTMQRTKHLKVCLHFSKVDADSASLLHIWQKLHAYTLLSPVLNK